MEGNFWFGSRHKGVFMFKKSRVKTLFPHLNVKSVYKDRTGKIWMGTTYNGLFTFDKGEFQKVEIEDFDYSRDIRNIFQSNDGTIWISSGTYFYSINGLKQKKYTLPENRKTFSFCEYEGKFIVGSSRGVFYLEDDKIVPFSSDQELMQSPVNVLYEDSSDVLWLGTFRNGLFKKNGEEIVHFKESTGLTGNFIETIHEDSEKRLWIGTKKGITLFDKDGTIHRIKKRDGLFDSSAFSFIEDRYGYFWIGCNKGIYRVKKRELLDFTAGNVQKINSIFLNENDGMVSRECNGATLESAALRNDGKILFSTLKGAVLIDPEDFEKGQKLPDIHIESVELDSKKIELSEGFYIPAETGKIIFRFTGISFKNSERIKFRYKLEGFDKKWHETSERKANTPILIPEITLFY